jgi:hypothetical protein
VWKIEPGNKLVEPNIFFEDRYDAAVSDGHMVGVELGLVVDLHYIDLPLDDPPL